MIIGRTDVRVIAQGEQLNFFALPYIVLDRVKQNCASFFDQRRNIVLKSRRKG